MRDVHVTELAARQFNRFSSDQLEALRYRKRTIEHRLDAGRWVTVEPGVYAIAPVLDDDWGRWMGATLTAPETFLSHWSAGAAYGDLAYERPFVTVTRPGDGGPVRHGGVRVYRSETLPGEVGELRGVPITSPERTLIDLAAHLSFKALARAAREAIRLELTTLESLGDAVQRHRGRRGTRKLLDVMSSYAGIPLERARSGAEVRAMIVLRDAGRKMPRLNRNVAAVEADLSWPRHRLIIEIDGDPFHQDVGEDARKQAIWEAAGYTVLRISSDEVHERPHLLLAMCP